MNGGATATLNGGTVISDANIFIGERINSAGTLTINDGSWANSGNLYVGYSGIGTLNINGGAFLSLATFVGNFETSTGTITLRGGALTTNQLSKGAGSGTVTFNGGTLRLADNQPDLFTGFSAGNVTLSAGGGGTIDTQAFAVTSFYDFSGAGGLTKQGVGALTLTGVNTYSGNTTISNGTLQIGDGGTTGSIMGDIINNAALTINRSDAVVISNAISGTGVLNQNGSGTATFNGPMTAFTGTINVSVGTVILKTTTGGSVNVAAGASFGGTGTILGDLNNTGTLAPGNSPGILTIAGNLSLNSGGTLKIEIAGADLGQFDQVNVGGSAILGGTLIIRILDGFTPQAGQQFAFLNASGGLSGSFDGVASNYHGALAFEVVETNGSSSAPVIQVVSIPYINFALTRNQFIIANALDFERIFNPGGPFVPFTTVWDSLPTGQLSLVFEQLAPTQTSAVVSSTLSLSQSNALRFANRMQFLRSVGVQALMAEYGAKDNPMMLRVNPRKAGLWFESGGSFAEITGTDGNRGFGIEAGIANAGLDYQVGPDLVLGLYAGYQGAETTIDANGGEIDINGGGGNLFMLYKVSETGFYLQTMAGANANAYDTRRNFLLPGFGIATARGNSDGFEFNTNNAIGWEGNVGGFQLNAEAGLRYTLVEIDGFNETGAFPLNVAYSKQSGESQQSVVSARISRSFQVAAKTIIPEVRAGWRHEYLNQDLQTSGRFTAGLGAPFKVSTSGTGRDIADLGAGFTMLLSDSLRLTVNYDAQLADDYVAHNLTALMRLAW